MKLGEPEEGEKVLSFQNVRVRALFNRHFPGAHLVLNLGSMMGTKTRKTWVLAWSDLENYWGRLTHIVKRIL